MATSATDLMTQLGISPGSYADKLYELLLSMESQLACQNQVASSWSSALIQVPGGAPGIQGVELIPIDFTRLELGIFSLDTTNMVFIGPTNTGALPPSPQTGMPIQPLSAIIFSHQTAPLQRFGISAGSAGSQLIVVSSNV